MSEQCRSIFIFYAVIRNKRTRIFDQVENQMTGVESYIDNTSSSLNHLSRLSEVGFLSSSHPFYPIKNHTLCYPTVILPLPTMFNSTFVWKNCPRKFWFFPGKWDFSIFVCKKNQGNLDSRGQFFLRKQLKKFPSQLAMRIYH